MFDYSFDRLNERAAMALDVLQGHVNYMEEMYRARYTGGAHVPRVALLGHGRAGKDTAGLLLCEMFSLPEPVSSSLACNPFVTLIACGDPIKLLEAGKVSGSIEEITKQLRGLVYSQRHTHREFWIRACHALRQGDVCRLCRWALSYCPFAIGLRGYEELLAVKKQGVVDLTVWIDRDSVPRDPTVEFTRDLCDVVIENHASLDRFREKLRAFGSQLYRGYH